MDFDQREVKFGLVKKGEKRTHTYRFTNRGDTNLIIENISACDCTTLKYEEGKAYPPGASGEIAIVFDSSEKEEAEEILIDIILVNTEPGTDIPIFEQLIYTFDIEQ
jgi:hypothetical protein